MLIVKGLTVRVRAALDRFEEDYDYRWICLCGFAIDEQLTLLGIVDAANHHVDSGECKLKNEDL